MAANLTTSQSMLTGDVMAINRVTERGYRAVQQGYACYNLVRRGNGYQCFKAGLVKTRDEASRWTCGDETVELIQLKVS